MEQLRIPYAAVRQGRGGRGAEGGHGLDQAVHGSISRSIGYGGMRYRAADVRHSRPCRLLRGDMVPYAVKHHRQNTTKFADVFWAGKLLCGHKSANKDLDKAFEQAIGYVDEIHRHNPNDVPRHVIVCDFATMRLHDLQPTPASTLRWKSCPNRLKTVILTL